MSELKQILDFDQTELSAELLDRFSFKPFRSRQLFTWLYKFRVKDFELMTNITKEARELLAANYKIYRPKPVTVEQSKDGTRKYLFQLDDGSEIESVLICQPSRYTLCISSQVGCAIGCTFCATAQMGLKRNLATHEIVGQVLAVQDDVKRLLDDPNTPNPPEFFRNIVFMGMGEPLHNVDNVLRAVRILNDGLGLDFSSRKITVSTSGLVSGIKKFAEQNAQANLALSLNATTDEIREKIMPITKRWNISEVLEAVKLIPLKKNRRITIEYVMLDGINVSNDDLKRLPSLLKGIPSKINLIPYNDNAGLGFKPPKSEVIHRWQESLLDLGLNSTIRWSKGQDINAACGQLATKSATKKLKNAKE